MVHPDPKIINAANTIRMQTSTFAFYNLAPGILVFERFDGFMRQLPEQMPVINFIASIINSLGNTGTTDDEAATSSSRPD